MIFNDHSNLRGKHAPFSPSQYSWLGDSEEDSVLRYVNSYATQVGTILHALAKDYIDFGYKMTKFDKKQISLALLTAGIPTFVVERIPIDDIFETVLLYVNDAVGFHMEAEVPLYYSDVVFGTTDAIFFDEHEKILRIHDLKTGSTPAKIDQLVIYDALFCLEYGPILRFRPEELMTELRIYQNGEYIFHCPNPDDIILTMEQIKQVDNIITKAKQGRR